MATRFRLLYKWMVPGWLSVDAGEKVLHTISLLLDASAERMRLGLMARFPRFAGPSALALTGRGRLIYRGRSETNEHYAARLREWRSPRGHRIRGNAFGLLEQMAQYWGDVVTNVATIDTHGKMNSRASDGTLTRTTGNAWEWDAEPAASWSRFWAMVESADDFEQSPNFGDPDLWGGALGTPGYTVGIAGSTPEDWDAMRRLVYGSHVWRPAGTHPMWIVVSYDTGDLVAPYQEYWRWSIIVAGTAVATRDSDFSYVALDRELNAYGGDPTRWANDVTMPDATTESGDPTSFPTSTTLPNGTTYAGNPASFPTSVQLVDDGDLPQ